ncbi:VOC family protein [Mongoliibacter ruber]|uniref:Catechol 2,3-dioxygenase-like lactoylglutathione lyase family enzyme n=1 Tax=Mongoliibacter ruber TaxID=1750599 RepID=A0A2T0WFH8_9BACT|nr:VOC family protein [Mongoliibacter ruber]PRY85467.1 catechol 2,3-dioxygenase-like lactoylglutathione lyase family enzyme [Mongoliibacter ruber]
MKQVLNQITLVVRDYDEAITFYTQKLNFELLEDTPLSDSKRWVRVRPPGGEGCSLLLAKAVNKEQIASIGNQTGGRVFLFLYTDNIDRDLKHLLAENVKIKRGLSEESYGKVLVFEDLYGNLWDLIQPLETNL